MIFTRLARAKGTASTMALALAVATGAMVGSVAIGTPAHAEKKEKKEKPNYSKAFVEAYKPVMPLLQAATPDSAAIKAALPGLQASIETDDDRMAVGQAFVNAGSKTNDLQLAYQGLEMMLASGKVPAENIPLYNAQAGQLAYKYQDYDKARTYLQAAADAGYTKDDPQAFVAESYFAQDRMAEGVAYLDNLIQKTRAAGQPVSEAWVTRGLAMAYRSDMKAEAQKFAAYYVSEFPGEASWKDAIAIMLNTGGYENPEILDLLRLGRRAGTLVDGRTYMEYVDAADYRRLPAEVVTVINEGFAKGLIPRTDTYASDTLTQAASRAKEDQADMASLMKDARAAGAQTRTIMAAADALLSLGRPAEAEEFYTKVAGTAVPDAQVALTRLGICQFDQGKYDEAQATFAKVQGVRQPIANLWAIYAKEKAAGSL
jgi:hypothetical protein